jgi:hypothetical protein
MNASPWVKLVRPVMALSLLILSACTDPDSVSGSGFERGIDDDISATHNGHAPTSSNMGMWDANPLMFGGTQ